MSILEEINNLDDDKLEEYVEQRIEKLEEENEEESSVIGYCIDHIPRALDIPGQLTKDEIKVDCQITYNSYIPLYSKMVYQIATDEDSFITQNDGGYYYIDDDSYILDFCKSIKNKKINDFYDLIDEIYEFIGSYFGRIELIKREQLHQMIYKNENVYFDPINEHVFSTFKQKGSALCSEISLVVQNILSFLGYNSYFVIGKVKLSDKKQWVDHAFNLVKTEDNIIHLVDCSASIRKYDFNKNIESETAYIGNFDMPVKDVFLEMLINDNGLETNNYEIYKFSHDYFGVHYDEYRKYSIELANKKGLKEQYEEENKYVKVYTNNNNI